MIHDVLSRFVIDDRHQPFFAEYRSPFRTDMPAMNADQLSFGDLTQPRVEGEWLFVEVLGKPLRGFRQRFLENIGGIDTCRDSRVEEHGDHAFESLIVQFEQPLLSGNVARSCALDQVGYFRVVQCFSQCFKSQR